jgi:hypothetical protein
MLLEAVIKQLVEVKGNSVPLVKSLHEIAPLSFLMNSLPKVIKIVEPVFMAAPNFKVTSTLTLDAATNVFERINEETVRGAT